MGHDKNENKKKKRKKRERGRKNTIKYGIMNAQISQEKIIFYLFCSEALMDKEIKKRLSILT